MHCPICNTPETKVIDSRLLQDVKGIRRRRKCESCERRFTTYEIIEAQLPSIVKHDGRREAFNPEKIRKGISKACHKRPISAVQIEQIIEALEKNIIEQFEKEVPSEMVGKFVMSKLLQLDPVSYVRFASFYWKYEDIDEFIKSLKVQSSTHSN